MTNYCGEPFSAVALLLHLLYGDRINNIRLITRSRQSEIACYIKHLGTPPLDLNTLSLYPIEKCASDGTYLNFFLSDAFYCDIMRKIRNELPLPSVILDAEDETSYAIIRLFTFAHAHFTDEFILPNIYPIKNAFFHALTLVSPSLTPPSAPRLLEVSHELLHMTDGLVFKERQDILKNIGDVSDACVRVLNDAYLSILGGNL
ncbi:MAG: hypothetical protein RRY79_00520 [Clostridia bacterium]